MKNIRWIFTLLFVLINILMAQAQEVMNLSAAVAVALENNFDVKISKYQVEIADKNVYAGNAGLMPKVDFNANTNYSMKDTEVEFISNEGALRTTIDDAETLNSSASVDVNYTLFDGLGNVYRFKKLKFNKTAEELRYRQQVESVYLKVVSGYYEVARHQSNLKIMEASVEVSLQRLEQAKDKYNFGKATKLEVLNAEVDLSRDSTDLLDVEQRFFQAVRNLNVLLGQDIYTSYVVDEAIVFREDITMDMVVDKAMIQNASILSQEMQEDLTRIDMDITKARKSPVLAATGSYSYSLMEQDASQMPYNQSNGLSGGLTLRFNIYDGSQQRRNEQIAKLNVISQEQRTQKVRNEIERDAINAYTEYDYKRKILKREQMSVEQATLNFEKAKEQYMLGQATTLDFRNAQENLMSAVHRLNDSRFIAKVAEISVIQVMGELLAVNP